MKMYQKLFCIFLLIGWGCYVSAYIPSSDFILQSVVKNHGKGRYLIKQEVTFPLKGTQKVVEETWHIEGITPPRKGNKNMQLQMHLLAKASDLVIERFYRNDVVYQKTNKKLQTHPWPLEFIEPWFLSRSLNDLRRYILKHDMAGSTALNWNPARALQNSKTKHLPVALSRHQGGIMWVYQKQAGGSGLWIEQDKFLIRKLQLASGVEIMAKEYGDYSRNLKFPKNRIVKDHNLSIPIRVLEINSIPSYNKAFQKKMSLKSLGPSQSDEDIKEPLIQEFYSRFR